jgi:mannose-1-phosphate guanylyltransferase
MEASYPETDYAYLRKGESLRPGTFFVDHFVEKPDKETAEQLLASGNYYWNAGTFLYKEDTLLNAVRRLMPDLLNHADDAFDNAAHEDSVMRLNAEAFLKCEQASFDKAIMEPIENKALIPIRIGWSDRGKTFPSVGEELNKVDIAS